MKCFNYWNWFVSKDSYFVYSSRISKPSNLNGWWNLTLVCRIEFAKGGGMKHLGSNSYLVSVLANFLVPKGLNKSIIFYYTIVYKVEQFFCPPYISENSDFIFLFMNAISVYYFRYFFQFSEYFQRFWVYLEL